MLQPRTNLSQNFLNLKLPKPKFIFFFCFLHFFRLDAIGLGWQTQIILKKHSTA